MAVMQIRTQITCMISKTQKGGAGSFPLHDVGFVNSSDLAPPLLGGIIKGELGDAA